MTSPKGTLFLTRSELAALMSMEEYIQDTTAAALCYEKAVSKSQFRFKSKA